MSKYRSGIGLEFQSLGGQIFCYGNFTGSGRNSSTMIQDSHTGINGRIHAAYSRMYLALGLGFRLLAMRVATWSLGLPVQGGASFGLGAYSFAFKDLHPIPATKTRQGPGQHGLSAI